jgi:hypothetical protein
MVAALTLSLLLSTTAMDFLWVAPACTHDESHDIVYINHTGWRSTKECLSLAINQPSLGCVRWLSVPSSFHVWISQQQQQHQQQQQEQRYPITWRSKNESLPLYVHLLLNDKERTWYYYF